MLLPAETVFERMNASGSRQQPFLFGIDFEVKNGFFFDTADASESDIYYNINGFENAFPYRFETKKVELVKRPVSKYEYDCAFQIVHKKFCFV